jgi:spermidine/putrescine transport system ATP-binding protein
MLELVNLSKSFGAFQAVHPVNLSVQKGEFISLLGPSGCGKTTLLRMLGGFETPTSGQIKQNGKSIEALPPNQREFNMVFQRYALFPHLNVWENLAFGLKIKNIAPQEISSRVQEMLALVKLEGMATRQVATLSGGQQQRVALARALVNRPSVLLLDEPLSALDLKLRQQMQLELRAIQRRLGHSFIFVTHDQDEALTLSDRIAVMNHGVIEQVGTPQEIYENPRTAFVAQFIGSINRFQGKVKSATSKEAIVNFGTGEELSVQTSPGSTRELPTVSPGDEVAVLIRPEKILIKPSKEITANFGGPNQVRATIKEIFYHGAVTRYLLECGPLKSILVTQPNSALNQKSILKLEDSVVLQWSAQDALLMPQAPLVLENES